ncbi:hypothetical protein [Longimicrobium sp.]|jgi:hypothetical protein|uniref:hypothetical protein n=1 Tax=Longimicrobium sp. TaxID=2029185 RepID=UPI002ED898BE
MPTQGNAMAKKAAERTRRKAPSTQKRKNESDVTPDAETFRVIFADNGEAARDNLERFAPRV